MSLVHQKKSRLLFGKEKLKVVVKDIKVLLIEKCITQHKSLAFQYMIKKSKRHQKKLYIQEIDMEAT